VTTLVTPSVSAAVNAAPSQTDAGSIQGLGDFTVIPGDFIGCDGASIGGGTEARTGGLVWKGRRRFSIHNAAKRIKIITPCTRLDRAIEPHARSRTIISKNMRAATWAVHVERAGRALCIKHTNPWAGERATALDAEEPTNRAITPSRLLTRCAVIDVV